MDWILRRGGRNCGTESWKPTDETDSDTSTSAPASGTISSDTQTTDSEISNRATQRPQNPHTDVSSNEEKEKESTVTPDTTFTETVNTVASVLNGVANLFQASANLRDSAYQRPVNQWYYPSTTQRKTVYRHGIPPGATDRSLGLPTRITTITTKRPVYC